MGCSHNKDADQSGELQFEVARRGDRDESFLMFHIGTNNWQRQNEFAPGSGILHASFHRTFNQQFGANAKCYSIYPSKVQTDPVEEADYIPTFKIFKLTHDIPICESVSPNSSFRWHSMSDAEFDAYRKRLEDEICTFMDVIEAREGRSFDCLISHHAFTNAMTGAQILERRQKAGNAKLKHFNFVHGTALKMYIKEMEKDPEYPERFLPLAQKHGVFNSLAKTSGVWVNSKDYIDKFCACFPEYPKSNVVYSQIGVDQQIFKPRPPVEGTAHPVGKFVSKGKEGFDRVKRVVTFVGKFADWKRLDAVLYAAAEYEAKFSDLGTLIVGTGPPEAVELYENLAGTLGLKRTFFAGSRSQDELAEIFSWSELGMFPSYKEPFGMVFIECFACGTPAIGANSGGPVEFVKPEQGLLVQEEDEWRTPEGAQRLGSTVAAAVERALNEEWKKNKGAGCVKYVQDNFSTFAQCNAMLQDMKRWGM